MALAAKWHIAELIFFMPLAQLLSREDERQAPTQLLAAAAQAQRLQKEQQLVEMPLSFTNGSALPTRLPPANETWRGIGTGGYTTGTVVRVSHLVEIPQLTNSNQAVLVMPTISPAHALAAQGAKAVICEYGEHLGHGAAMARELNIPCIVGCKRAWRELRSGDEVAVHGQAGLVARLKRR